MKVYIAGAGGAVGRRLVPQLIAAGHEVLATTRSDAKLDALRRLGAHAAVVDGLDAAAVGRAVAEAEPEVIVHQMSALATMGSNPRRFDKDFALTNRLRTEGLDHLLAAAKATGVRKVIAQSYIGWNNRRDGGPVKTEADGLDPNPAAAQRQSLAAIEYLERALLDCQDLETVALRYGFLYGPGSSESVVGPIRKRQIPLVCNANGIWSWLHVDDAASAAVAALDRGDHAVYNIVDDDPAPVAKWLPYLAEVIGAKPPRRLPLWLVRLVGGEVVVRLLTEIRGSSNARAKTELGWQPRWRSWRDGFAHALTTGAMDSSRPGAA
jgi:nucleoside-diphosphate-sugar epimerase